MYLLGVSKNTCFVFFPGNSGIVENKERDTFKVKYLKMNTNSHDSESYGHDDDNINNCS